jgi:hypothetical protein
MRATWSPDNWSLNLGIFLDGEPIGSQSVCGVRFSAAKTLQETLQLCTDKCGKSACKVLARSLFLPALRNKRERNSIAIP